MRRGAGSSRSSSRSHSSSRSSSSRSSYSSSRSYSSWSGHRSINSGHSTVHRPRTNIHIHAGSPYHIHEGYCGGDMYERCEVAKSKKTKFAEVLLVLSIIATIIFLIWPGIVYPLEEDVTIEEIEADYVYYHSLIDKANDTMADLNPFNDRVVDGKIISIFKQDYSDRYYFRYSFEDFWGLTNYSTTFAVFKESEIDTVISQGDHIKVAVDDWCDDSAPIIMRDYTYSDDGDYIALVEYDQKFGWIEIARTISIAGIIISAILLSNFRKRDRAQANNSASANTQFETQTATTSNPITPITYKCRYCGSIVSKDAKRCDSCGASVDFISNVKK